MGNKRKQYNIGDIYFVNFGKNIGSVQSGWRPGLVFQNNMGNKHSPNLIMLPITTALKKKQQPTHVILPANETGLLQDSLLLCENPEIVSKNQVGKYITTLPDEYMERVAAASLLATSVISYLNPEILIKLWDKAVSLNGKKNYAVA